MWQFVKRSRLLQTQGSLTSDSTFLVDCEIVINGHFPDVVQFGKEISDDFTKMIR